MFYIEKTMEISAAHWLGGSYDLKCRKLHGHNWIITVYCKSEELDENGVVVDFTRIKKNIHDEIDHTCLNDTLISDPTAERIAALVCNRIPKCYKVKVQESTGNIAIYEKGNNGEV